MHRTDLALPLGIALGVFLVGTYALGAWVSRKVDTKEDFLVAGRRLPLSLAWATLLATWFGAGTMLTAADAVRDEGLHKIALEPLGAGTCLILAGFLIARRLWDMNLLTMSDFFARRFGPRAELFSALIMVPGYFGWIAVQFVALSGILDLFFGIDPVIGIAIVAVVGMGYTLMGGMWAVTVTDAAQLALLLIGLLILGGSVLMDLGHGTMLDGFTRLETDLPDGFLEPIPTGSASELLGWLSVLAVAALGNLPGQDLMQRIFAAKTARVAQQACVLAGIGYIAFGSIPVMLGLASRILLPDEMGNAIVPALAHAFLSPALAVVFTVALTAAVISTIDSAILSPSSVLAQNVLPRVIKNVPDLTLNRLCVVGVTLVSLLVAYVGESMYSLLEGAYEIGLDGLFVPLIVGLYRTPRRESSALGAMGLGFGSWALHLAFGWETFLGPVTARLDFAIPPSLATVAAVLALYFWLDRGNAPADSNGTPTDAPSEASAATSVT